MWFLLRQWQVGEFAGRDAGSPVTAAVQTSAAAFDRIAVGGQTPEPLAPSTDDAAALSVVVAGRVIDGIKLYADLNAAGAALPALPRIPADSHDAVPGVTRAWLTWYASLFCEPTLAHGWSADRLEYAFSMAAAGSTTTYIAKEYDGGSVDWSTFDSSAVALGADTAAPSTASANVVISPVTFRGMPARRFWEIEDAAVNIGALSAGPEDLGRLLLRDFALIYGNDWFMFPLTCAVGAQIEITSLSVTDTFGVVTTIPHYSVVDGAAGAWRMFALRRMPLTRMGRRRLRWCRRS